MLIFPPEFTPIVKYPGYVWNLKEQHLYSYKSGSLKRLPLNHPNHFNHWREPGYKISHLGIRRGISLAWLKKLTADYKIHAVPVVKGQLSLDI
jgi:hypothetical protein